jgi:hypothetical protein
MGTITATPTDFTGQPIGPTRTIAVETGTPDLEMPPMKTSIPKLVAWVGYDPERAKAVLVREHAGANPRTTLIDELEAIVNRSS